MRGLHANRKVRLRELIALTKGFGFIEPAEDGPDVFVHISAAQKAGYTELVDGARVSYELVPTRNGKVSAEDSRLS
jgi:CspA family cold shock protein